MTKGNVRLGLVQMKMDKNPKKNLEKALKNIEWLAKRGAQIICLPELFVTSYFCQTPNNKFFDSAEIIPGPTTSALSLAAGKHKVVIIASIFEKANRRYYNTAVVIGANGSLKGKYRKMHVPDDMKNHYGESYYFHDGNLGFRSYKTAYAKVGPMVCFDQWFPEGARMCAAKGAEILFYPTAIGFLQKNVPALIAQAEYEAWQTIQRSHAIANNVFVCTVNRVGKEDHLRFWGTSFVCDPYGRVLVKGPIDKEANLIADCDLSLIPDMRKDWPFLDARRIKI